MNTPVLLTLNALALIALTAFHFQPAPESLPYTHADPRQAAQRAVMSDHLTYSSALGEQRQATVATGETVRLTF
ncbi:MULTISPECIES: hypothetical protein [Pseudomonas]|uniref:Uncharacterized protein n=1 Tax=Pseudomonas gingeri TaxID=117681 RepID=A0A7Y8BVB3_9PSED|nr:MULTISPECIES: hypothetical protein [Pseudomonas]NWB88562.1 hypothetical protein [Pseudomonas gingeri]